MADPSEDEDEEEKASAAAAHQPRRPLGHCGREQRRSAAWPPGWGSPLLLPPPCPPRPESASGPELPEGRVAGARGGGGGGCPESVHPGLSVLTPVQRILGCSPGWRKWTAQVTPGQGVASATGSGRWGPFPWVPGSLGRSLGAQASQHPVSLRFTLTPSLPTVRAMGGGGSGKVGNPSPENLLCARPCNSPLSLDAPFKPDGQTDGQNSCFHIAKEPT